MKEVMFTSILKTIFLGDGLSLSLTIFDWFVLGMVRSVEKVLKLKVRKIWGLISTFEKVIGKKLVGEDSRS